MSDNEQLFSQFPPVSTEEWKSAIIKDLKGADYEKKLVWKTNEGFNVQPFYRDEDLASVQHLKDGIFPIAKRNASRWTIRQNYLVDDGTDIKRFLEIIRQGIDNGVESVGVDMTQMQLPIDESFVFEVIKETDQRSEVVFMCNTIVVESVFVAMMKYLEENHIDKDTTKFHVEYDPLHDFITEAGNYMAGIDILRNMINTSKTYKNMRVGIIDAALFGNCGSYTVDELAFGLSEFADILDYLTESGLGIDAIVRKLKFVVGIGSNYFFEIARLRACRHLWAQIVKAYKPTSDESLYVYVHAVTSSWNKTVYDPYVNMLRTTTEAMSSIVGGIDSLTVLPFNFITDNNDEFALRIARNQQIILREESHFDAVADPAAGSYYIETMTHEIIVHAWKRFLEIIDNGGFIDGFKKNYIQDILHASNEKRDNLVATRRENFVGITQYPNITETIDYDVVAPHVFESANTCCFMCEDMKPKFSTLKPYRGAEKFEKLRLQTEFFTKEHNHRPKVFLFTMGNLTMRIARSGFASNFFGCAGYEIINNNGFETIDEGVAAAKKSKAEIVVICSSDEEYADIAVDIYNKLKDDAIVVMAGNPVECIEELKKSGIEYFIHVKTNLLDSLRHFQSLIIKK